MAAELSGCMVNGRYSVDKKIQSGYYGTTWLAVDKLQSKEVCLKTFFSENHSQRKELDILKKLSDGQFYHENLCSVLDICVEKAPVLWGGDVILRTPYVVFEYCSGTDLFNFIVTGPFERNRRVSGFPEPLARHYFIQALLAVMYLHERGVFHRDIKPENCVLDHNFNLKLTDFGTNKFMTVSSGQLLRANTKGVGTDSYRAPEVNGIDYDPSAADVWSLGVTLVFMVGVEHMVEKAQQLDQYMRPLMAPLGILFPFPFFCRFLDTYMKSAADVSNVLARAAGGTVSRCFPNRQFWSEWSSFRDTLSAELLDFFNSIFVLCSAHRGVLRDLARHSWISSGVRLSPDEIVTHMKERCPRGIVTSLNASPSVMASKKLGGVDQATLRQSLSNHNSLATPSDYLADAELWVWSEQLDSMEALQLDIANSDLQEMIMDISFCRQILRDLQQDPGSERSRSVAVADIKSSWVTQMLGTVGFLPQARLLYLMRNNIDMALIHCALCVLEGVELAVSRGVINISADEYDGEDMATEPAVESLESQLLVRLSNMDSGTSTMHTTSQPSTQPLPPSSQPQTAQLSSQNSHNTSASSDSRQAALIRDSSSEPTLFSSPDIASEKGSLEPQSSQESNWTSYSNMESLSAQSSQEELPEAMMMAGDCQDYSTVHYIMELSTLVDRHKPMQYRAAGEFCKLSGLLCSYGLYQVVCNDQLSLYCRGNNTSFSARLLSLEDSGKIGISSWCFQGIEEWVSILLRLSTDMTSQM